MKTIAESLGVSRQLVSLALRDAPGASAETKERVRRVALELGYSPHIAARSLRRSQSRHVGVVFQPQHSHEPAVVAAIYEVAEQEGFHVVLGAETQTRSTSRALDELIGYRCAAVILMGSAEAAARVEDIAARLPVPLVAVNCGAPGGRYDVVHSAGDRGTAQAVEHLAALGHRHIAYVHPTLMPVGGLRHQGYCDAVRRHGLRRDVVRVTSSMTEEAGSTAARVLLARPALPTAVACANDQIAFGLMQVLLRQGVRVPEDVSVTGYDDDRLARLSAVDLTTVQQDATEMGRKAFAAAARRIADAAAGPEEHLIQPSLVVRSSSAPPRGATAQPPGDR
jgi:DNA-binding LacI/PurR family transcriptional regulator